MFEPYVYVLNWLRVCESDDVKRVTEIFTISTEGLEWYSMIDTFRRSVCQQKTKSGFVSKVILCKSSHIYTFYSHTIDGDHVFYVKFTVNSKITHLLTYLTDIPTIILYFFFQAQY